MQDRNSTPHELQKVGGSTPDWLAEYGAEDRSTDLLKQYRVIPRIKVIQSLSLESLKEEFGEGSAIVTPGNVLVAKRRESVEFVPLLFFPEWIKWADRDDKTGPPIIARTFDASSQIAKNAKDPKTRIEIYGTNLKARYVEHLNFVGLIRGAHELAGSLVVLSFSRGEHSTGTSFISSISLRRVGGNKQAPLWSGVWKLTANLRDRGTKKWWGMDYNPASEPWIKPEEAPVLRAMHEELLDQYQKQLLIVDQTTEDEVDDAPTSNKF